MNNAFLNTITLRFLAISYKMYICNVSDVLTFEEYCKKFTDYGKTYKIEIDGIVADSKSVLKKDKKKGKNK